MTVSKCTFVCMILQASCQNSSIPVINNTQGCDTNELCLSFIINIPQAEGKSEHIAVCHGDFPSTGS